MSADEERTRLTQVYRCMVERCYNELNNGFKNYGKRGISICDEWLQNRESFIRWSIENGSKKGLQIDRIDNDGNYEPKNCRYVTPLVNNRNRRNPSDYDKQSSDMEGLRRLVKARKKSKTKLYHGTKKTKKVLTKQYAVIQKCNSLSLDDYFLV